MSASFISVREARASDFMKVLATLTEVPGRLTLTPDQLNWVLKECEIQGSAYQGWVALNSDDTMLGVLIGKQKRVDEINQFEVLFLESRLPGRRESFPALLEALVSGHSEFVGPGVVVYIPNSDVDLKTYYQNAEFKPFQVLPNYYADGSSAEVWTRSIATKKPPQNS